MTRSLTASQTTGDELAYLCVDDFLKTFVDARVLKTALELKLIDCLQADETSTLDTLTQQIGCDRSGLQLLLGMLQANQIIAEHEGSIKLSEPFLQALRFRDLLEAKLDFASLVAPDFFNHFTSLLMDPSRFVQEARLFKLFDYGRCFDATAENIEWTRQWMRFTTALTRYEAPVCVKHFDFGGHQRMLDIGGNSGEFALQICKKQATIQATVLDLPVVCDIGRLHVRHEAEAARITFIKANALRDEFPGGFDLITFKSFLHDWPEVEAQQFIDRAVKSLVPGGRVLIYERGPLQIGKQVPFSMLPMLMFFRSFRPASIYERQLKEAGCQRIEIQTIHLETSFHLLTAQKPI
jgi:ubiquinone/menaquinone biosynthesis C-methylase UbiE